MKVVKRDGRIEMVELDKVTQRVVQLCQGPGGALDRVDPVRVSSKVVSGLYSGVTTVELDRLAVETAAALTTSDPQYGHLASRIAISNMHKTTPATFSECIQRLHEYRHAVTGAQGVIDPALHDIVMENSERLDAAVVPERDYGYTLFGFHTLCRAYLLRCDGELVERPGYMLMRVALGLHGADVDGAIAMYNDTSQRLYTMATPTIFNSGTKRPQLSSCFLTGLSDSIEGIYKTLTDCALISRHAGGLGLHAHDIRASGSFISGTGGRSNGLVPMLKVFNESARLVDQVR